MKDVYYVPNLKNNIFSLFKINLKNIQERCLQNNMEDKA